MAKPSRRPDGSQNLFEWKCLVPGPPGTDWAPANTTWGHYPVRLVFGTDYPSSPPTCYFDANFFREFQEVQESNTRLPRTSA